jgi:hypothetical protein
MRVNHEGDTPKEELFQVFCAYDHIPRSRNSRPGYLIVQCNLKGCSAQVNVSANVGDGWTVTGVTDAVLTNCTISRGHCKEKGIICWFTMVYGGVRL